MNLRAEVGSDVSSLERVRALTGIDRPASILDVLTRYREPIVFDEPLITSDGVALGGHHTITIQRDGRVRHEGHMRATGFPSFTFAVRTLIVNEAGVPLLIGAGGRVHGTNELGDRESSWDESDRNGLIALHWDAIKRARADTSVDRETDIFGAFGDVASFVASLAVGAVLAGPAGVCIVLGAHAANAVGLDEELAVGGLPGLAVTGGVLLVFGPSAIIPALIAGGAVGVAFELALEHRPMTGPERDFAAKVFGATLPVDRIRLTNLLGIGRRPFTIPTVGDSILVNLGEGLGDPVNYPGFGDSENPNRQSPGQLFIHELTHAWQIQTETFLPGLICEAISASSTTIGGDMGIYRYGDAGPDLSSFNPEQRASIVDDWYAGSGQRQNRFTASLESDDNPYFRYIRDNIRRSIP